MLLVDLGDGLLLSLLVDMGDKVGGEVQDALKVARRDIEQQAQAARRTLDVPDVRNRRRQFDVAHPLPAYLRAGDLDAALVTDGAGVADPLVLAAVALPVLGGTEDALAEKTAVLRLQRPVVDGLGLGDFSVGPAADAFRRREHDLDGVKVVDVQHAAAVPAITAGVSVPTSAGTTAVAASERGVIGDWRQRTLDTAELINSGRHSSSETGDVRRET